MKKSKRTPSRFARASRIISASVFVVVLLFGLGMSLAIPFLFSKQPQVCANSVSCIHELSGKYNPSLTTAILNNEPIAIPRVVQQLQQPKPVLGTSTGGGYRKIFVNLTTQQLFAYEGSQLIYAFPISSGKTNPTPTGEFRIWIKLLATTMEGGTKTDGTYYHLPNVPYTMYFYNKNIARGLGYGIHGSYWHVPFGHPSSYGCVILSPQDAATLFSWATPVVEGPSTLANDDNPGTPVIIFGKAPTS